MKKRLIGIMLSSMMVLSLFQGSISTIAAATKTVIEIAKENIKAYSSNNHEIKNAIDKDTTTYWKSVNQNGEGSNREEKLYDRMYDHNTYIDIVLDGTYDLSDIEIFNNVDGSYNNYYIYTSTDGVNFNKVVSKVDNQVATEAGDSHSIDKRASYVRLNMAYNSNSFETNLAEINLYGTKVSGEVTAPEAINTTDWKGSEWQKEWDHFANDASYANQKTIKEVKDLVGRVIGENWKDSFNFEIINPIHDDQDLFEILDGANNTITIRGNDGVSLASGFNYYLKNYVNVDYNPLFGSNVEMKGIEKVGKKVTKETQYDYRYALNFCTYSYTMSFWSWDEYEEFIDWAAMNGVNLMLDIVGQEEVLRQTLNEYGFNDEEVKNYISGPAYFAWFYMQNLYSFGGPLPNAWFEQRVELGRQMHDRMQAYGIDPVIQGFAGQVPETFVEKNEGAVLTPVDEWPSFTRPSIIKTYLTDAEIAAGKKNYFAEVATTFYEKQRNVFGDVSKFYAADPFHEGGNTTGLDVGNIYKVVQNEMIKADEDAIWVMQQWQGNLNTNKLSGLEHKEQALALDLQSDMNQQNDVMENLEVPWIYNMLHNFGGRMGLDGEIPVIATDPATTYQSKKHMKGIGITPEALENSPVVYELLFDMTWSKDPIDYQAWLEKYAQRRAGGNSESLQAAWDTLLETAYADKGIYFQGAAESVINARPTDNFNSASTWGHSNILYDKKKLDSALALLKENYDDFKNSPAYTYDLADVSEQVLSNAAIEYQRLMVKAKNDKDVEEFKKLSTQFLEIIDLSDQILNSSDEFMLGTWINDARKMIVDADDWTKDLFEFNARALVTTWGGQRSNSLKDYSNRKWAGLTEDFYKVRWQIWVNNRLAELEGKAKNPADVKAESNWFLWEWQWVNRKSDDGFAYSTEPTTDGLKGLIDKAVDTYSVTAMDKFISGPVEDKVNIAKGKKVTSTSQTDMDAEEPGTLKNITDDSTGSGWTALGAGPHVIEVDLEKTYDISEMVLSIKQAAGDYPFDYKVETYDPEQSSWIVIKEVKDEIMQSNESIGEKCVASKIRVTMSTRDVDAFKVYVSEIAAYGKEKNVKQYNNLAKGKTVTTNKTNTDSKNPLTNIVDDNVDTLWKTTDWGTSAYPAWINVDLEGVVNAEYVELYLEKPGLPFIFNVEATLKDGSTQVIFDEYANHTGTVAESTFKIPVNKSIKSVKVNITGITGKGEFGVAGPCIKEIKVLSSDSVAPIVNIAQGAKVSSNKTNASSGYELNKITDGNDKTFWKTTDWGASSFPGIVEVDLGKASYVNTTELVFEKAGTPFKFKVYVADESGQYADTPLLDRSTHTGTNDHKYALPVNQVISKIKVELVGTSLSGAMAQAGPAIAEIKAFATQKEEDIVFVNGKIGSVSVSGKGSNLQNTIDGNKTTFSTGILENELIFDLGNFTYVDKAIFTFEKKDLGLKYKVYAEDKEGNRTLLTDTSSSKDLITSADVEVKVKQGARKIIFVHLGNNGQGPAYLADARLYEFEAFGAYPDNMAKDAKVSIEAAQSVVDGDDTTGYRFEKNNAITLTLTKAIDINMMSIVKDSEEAVSFAVEAYDDEKGEWVSFIDKSNNTSTEKELFALASKSMYSAKLRITFFNDEIKINEIKVYDVDATQSLIDKIKAIRAIVDSKEYLGYSGNYTVEAKTKIEAELAAAEEAMKAGLNSKAVSEWITKLEKALYNFNKFGVVYVDRTDLLSAMTTAKSARAILVEKGVDVSELDAAYTTAESVYATYRKTQAEMDAAKNALNKAVEDGLAHLDLVDRYTALITLANEALNNAVVGDYHGNVTQDAKTKFATAIENAMEAYKEANGNQTKIAEIITSLETAITTFENAKIVVNKDALQALIVEIPEIDKTLYDKDTYQVFKSAYDKANEVLNKTEVSQGQVDKAYTTLSQAYAKLTLLNKDALRSVLTIAAQKEEVLYKAEAWKTFIKVVEEAQALLSKEELAQSEIDAMVTTLEKAIEVLEENKEEVKPEVDKTALNELINSAMDVEVAIYTASTGGAFEQALAAAQDVYDNEKATHDEVETARLNLQIAKDHLVIVATSNDIRNLRTMIDQVEALRDQFTSEEFASAQAALNIANALLTVNANEIAQSDSHEAWASLVAAKDELANIDTALKVLRKELKTTIEIAEATLAKGTENIRPAKVAALQKAIADGKALLTANSKDKEALKDATTSIIYATQELWEIVNKDKLNNMIAIAEKLTGNYTVASKEALDIAVASAKVVAANKDATTDEVNDAHQALADAIINLQEVANKAALTSQIQITQGILANSQNYVTSTIRGLQTALNDALLVLDNETATQTQVDQATKTLSELNIKARLKADKSALVEVLTIARSINLSTYTNESATNVRATIAHANAVVANDEATQAEVNAAIISLKLMMNSLVLAPTQTPEVAVPETVAPQAPITRTPTTRTQPNVTEDKMKQETVVKETTPKTDNEKQEKITQEETPKSKLDASSMNWTYIIAGLAIIIALGGAFVFFKRIK